MCAWPEFLINLSWCLFIFCLKIQHYLMLLSYCCIRMRLRNSITYNLLRLFLEITILKSFKYIHNWDGYCLLLFTFWVEYLQVHFLKMYLAFSHKGTIKFEISDVKRVVTNYENNRKSSKVKYIMCSKCLLGEDF